MIEIVGPAASRTRRALWVAEEAGVPYVHRPVSVREGQHRSPEFLALHAYARVPVLVHGDLVLFESSAICLYLARQDPEQRLLPARGSVDEARHDQWVSFLTTELEQPLWTMGKHRFALPEEHRLPQAMPGAKFEWDRAATFLASSLGDREHLVGGRLSVADLLLAHTLAWARGTGVALGDPRLDAFLDRALARPSWERIRALP